MLKITNIETWKYFLKHNGENLVKKKTDYDKIVKELNTAFMETLAREGGYMSLGGFNGILFIHRKKRNVDTMTPDFPESNKIRAEIVARGGIPLENFKDENGKLTGENNGGEPWLVYYTDPFYYKVEWRRHKYASKTYHEFDFKPNKFTRTNNSAIINENKDRSMLVHSKNFNRDKAKPIDAKTPIEEDEDDYN